MIQRRVVLASRPVGIPQAEHFRIEEVDVPDLADGEVLVRNTFLSVDPAQRGWVNAAANYSEPVGVGEVMRALATGEVVQSRHASYQVSDRVLGFLGWQEYAVTDGSAIQRTLPDVGVPDSAWLGVLGLTGITAYVGLERIGQPKPGETVVVSTAAGSVGSAVGQLAKRAGCTTVGIAGGPAKVADCREVFGYDEAIDYRDPDFPQALARACPDGVDVYFDNTAGAISDAVHQHLNVGARVIICGTASISVWDPPPLGPRVERLLLAKRARMQGLLVFDHEDAFGEAEAALLALIQRGELAYREDVLEGLETAPDAIAGLYRGENRGKRVIRLR